MAAPIHLKSSELDKLVQELSNWKPKPQPLVCLAKHELACKIPGHVAKQLWQLQPLPAETLIYRRCCVLMHRIMRHYSFYLRPHLQIETNNFTLLNFTKMFGQSVRKLEICLERKTEINLVIAWCRNLQKILEVFSKESLSINQAVSRLGYTCF